MLAAGNVSATTGLVVPCWSVGWVICLLTIGGASKVASFSGIAGTDFTASEGIVGDESDEGVATCGPSVAGKQRDNCKRS